MDLTGEELWKWYCEELTKEEQCFVKRYVNWYHCDSGIKNPTMEMALRRARMVLILRKAIGVYAYGSLMTPREVYNNWFGNTKTGS